MSVHPLHPDRVCHTLHWDDPAVPIICHVTVQPYLFFTAPWLGVSLRHNRLPFPFSLEQLVILNQVLQQLQAKLSKILAN